VAGPDVVSQPAGPSQRHQDGRDQPGCSPGRGKPVRARRRAQPPPIEITPELRELVDQLIVYAAVDESIGIEIARKATVIRSRREATP
jgi:hypothetical protein